MIAPVMVIAVQSPGLVMALLIVPNRLMAVILPAMKMMAVTVMKLLMMAVVVVLTVSGIVAMANVFQLAMYVMAQMNSAMLDGDLTVPMAQMKA